jgi:nitrogen fixation-related uncharacterized protein
MSPPRPERLPAGRTSRVLRWVTATMLVAIAAGGAGFAYKLIQFSKEALTSEVASFALVPILTYVLVSIGFSCLFVWALCRGQFTDVEGPKYRLLELEERHDRAE